MVIRIDKNDIRRMVREAVEKILAENVFIDADKVNRKQKTVGLTYARGRSKNPVTYWDRLKTDKMDEDSANTYEVMLKGGIVSYNITDIMGTEVMHYFKRLWDNKSTKINVQVDGRSEKEEYELKMLKDEETEFLNRFKKKIEIVVSRWCDEHKVSSKQFSGISIYPVPSSSRFNEKMAELLSAMNVYGLPIQVVNQGLMAKDLKNLEKDTDFIEKNKEYFNKPLFKNDVNGTYGTIQQNIDTSLSKYKAMEQADIFIGAINRKASQMLSKLSYIKTNGNNANEAAKMARDYKVYYDLIMECYTLTYQDEVLNQKRGFNRSSLINLVKYSKGPSIAGRSESIWSIVEPYLKTQKCHITGKEYTPIEIGKWSRPSFEMKHLGNSIRMGLRNFYSPNDTDPEMVQKELKRIHGTVFLIFDDNISGGATLGDICYQCKKLGIENIVPITFGVMNEKWVLGRQPLTIPSKKGKNGRPVFNYQ